MICELLADVDSVQASADASERIRLLFEERELHAVLGRPSSRNPTTGSAARQSRCGRARLARTRQGVVRGRARVLPLDPGSRRHRSCRHPLLGEPVHAASARVLQPYGYQRRRDGDGRGRADDGSGGGGRRDDDARPVNGDRSQSRSRARSAWAQAVVAGEVTLIATPSTRSRSRSARRRSRRSTWPIASTAGPVTSVSSTCPRASSSCPCLTEAEVFEDCRSRQARRAALGAPQDIEWAIGPGPSGPREAFLLQTRPETVWSRTPTKPPVASGSTQLDRT